MIQTKIDMKSVKRLLFTVLFIFPLAVLAQESMTGAVIDSVTREALPFATVYVNGTTKGTITDDFGLFELKNVNFPVDVVISFVGYKTQVHHLTSNPGYLLVELKTNDRLPEVVITDFNERENIMRYFKQQLLGNDYWAKHATIRDEDILMFELEGMKMRAWATEPIIIELPLLGFELYLDLVSFEAEHVDRQDRCDMLGYYFYKLIDTGSKSKERKIIKNRQQAFYNSSLHFLTSLYEDRLEENGFTVTELMESLGNEDPITDIRPYIKSTGDNEKQICGLKGRQFLIRYTHKRDGSPVNLNNIGHSLHDVSLSHVVFLDDTCKFTGSGLVSDNSIRFMGDIAEKRVAASLPAE